MHSRVKAKDTTGVKFYKYGCTMTMRGVRQVRLGLLQPSAREAVLLLLSALPDEDFHSILDAAHGEVTLEFRVSPSHPILDQVPAVYASHPSGAPSAVAAAPASNQTSHIRHTSPTALAASPSVLGDRHDKATPRTLSSPPSQQPQQSRVLRAANARPPSPMMRQTSASAAAVRKGAAARNRSLSRSPSPLRRAPSPLSGPLSSSLRGPTHAAGKRTPAWATKQIDEMLSVVRRMRVDRRRITCVEELLSEVVATRFGVTPQHRRMLSEIIDTAHTFADLSPLCNNFQIFAAKRSPEALAEFLSMTKFLGAVLPWATTETVKVVRTDSTTTPPSSVSHLVLRRYVSFGDIPLVLRDALPLVAPRGSFLLNEMRRWLQQWCKGASKHPRIAFDLEAHVDADVLSLIMLDALREAKAAVPVGSEWGTLGELEVQPEHDEDVVDPAGVDPDYHAMTGPRADNRRSEVAAASGALRHRHTDTSTPQSQPGRHRDPLEAAYGGNDGFAAEGASQALMSPPGPRVRAMASGGSLTSRLHTRSAMSTTVGDVRPPASATGAARTSASSTAFRVSESPTSRYREALRHQKSLPSSSTHAKPSRAPVVVTLSPRRPLGWDDRDDEAYAPIGADRLISKEQPSAVDAPVTASYHDEVDRRRALRRLLEQDAAVETAKRVLAEEALPGDGGLPPLPVPSSQRSQAHHQLRRERDERRTAGSSGDESSSSSTDYENDASTMEHGDWNGYEDRPESSGAQGSGGSLDDMRAALEVIEQEIRRRKGSDGKPVDPKQDRTRPRAMRDDPLFASLGHGERDLLAQLEASLQSKSRAGGHGSSAVDRRRSPPRPLESVAMS